MPILSGPSHLPAPGRPLRQLVVLLHGYGADGNDLLGLAPFFARALPDAEFLSPNAPERCDMGFGYQWFPINNLDRAAIAAGVSKAGPILDAFLDEALAARNLKPAQLALIGFSQGTMMALDRAMRRPDGVAAIAGFSGMVPRALAATPAASRHAPILLIHGTADPVVPFERLTEAETLLKQAGFPVETLPRPGLQHGIDAEGALAAARFLAEHMAVTQTP
jgi:phospholipase/carboxylesterase